MTPSTLHLRSLTIGQNRGAARLWLQGRSLAASGAVPGARFDLHANPTARRIVILIHPNGGRVVSAKPGGTPVIDSRGSEIGQTFPTGTRIRVRFEPGRIVITIHPSDAAQAARAQRLKEKLLSGQEIDVGSLCFGAGVLDAALHQGLADAGVTSRLRFAVDVDGDALDHAMGHNPAWTTDTMAVADDIALVDPSELPPVDLLAAGLPCGPASRPGRAKQRSLDPLLRHPEGHPDGAAFIHLVRFVAALNPAAVVLENVDLYRDTAGYAALLTTLTTLGYKVTETFLYSQAWGVVEDRQRLAMVAVTGDAISLEDLAPNIPPEPLSTVLEDIPTDNVRWRDHGHHVASTDEERAAGNGFSFQLVGPETRRIGTIGRGYSRDRRTEPHLRHPTDPNRSRLLTVREHARIKQIPERMVSDLGHMRGHQLLGQSIAYPPFVSLGRRLGQWMRGDRRAFATGGARPLQRHASVIAPTPQLTLFSDMDMPPASRELQS
ncbi:DNA cytosine methyltransferase [Nitrospirillum amazonense]|uniref:DNA cytosine methyltransferase n=1 Tax=Nitrospirillum amazonense TaxID=28077 RepID=UPI002412D535|nr:DNA cytosine methyltransferase [Nitrospirillum amazonense]MDG3444651.1 DNA cytosine methyltransferase [Nitrospirillum amazonense]